MGTSPRRRYAVALAAATALVLGACAGGPGASTTRAGTVIDDGSEVRLCTLILESYPPQCGDGVVVHGWSWEGVEPDDSFGTVRWGDYTVEGVFDGAVFTVTGVPSPATP